MDESLRCPICRKGVPRGAPEFPFCSRRCRDVDLGNWFLGRYRVSRDILDPGEIEELEETEENEERFEATERDGESR